LIVSDTFSLRQDAQDWAVDREREIDRGEAAASSAGASAWSLGTRVR
jgi:hypothetical protein